MTETIDGVRITPLRLLPNDRGRLMEVQNGDDPDFPGFGNLYVTQSFAGVIKAWYRHHIQIDQLTVITGLAKLVLYDDREGSPTRLIVNEIILGELAPKRVLIPPGVWHGFKAIGDTGAFFLHLNSRPHNPDDQDEDRLAWDDPAIPYRW